MIRMCRKFWRGLSLACMCVLFFGCGYTGTQPVVPVEVQLKAAAKRACDAKGTAELAMAYALQETCDQKVARLNKLVSTDEDCKAYFGPATVVTAKAICD